MMSLGHSVVLYGKREFVEGETCAFMQSFANLHKNVVVDEDELEALFLSMEKDLNLLCAVGLEEELQEEVSETVQLFDKKKIKLHLFAEDSLNKTLPVAFNLRMLPHNVKFITLTSHDK